MSTSLQSGIASAIADVLVEHCPTRLYSIGMTSFSEVGSVPYLLDRFGFIGEKIATKIKEVLK